MTSPEPITLETLIDLFDTAFDDLAGERSTVIDSYRELQARLAASEEEKQQYAEAIRDWSLADTEGRTPQDTLASAETLQAWINRQSSANARLRELAANPPNGASALARAERLEDKLTEIQAWASPYLWLADGFGPYNYDEIASEWAEDVHAFVDGLRERLPLAVTEPLHTWIQQRGE